MSEITGLTWNQVDLDNGIVWLESDETKNKEAGRFILTMNLKQSIILALKKEVNRNG